MDKKKAEAIDITLLVIIFITGIISPLLCGGLIALGILGVIIYSIFEN